MSLATDAIRALTAISLFLPVRSLKAEEKNRAACEILTTNEISALVDYKVSERVPGRANTNQFLVSCVYSGEGKAGLSETVLIGKYLATSIDTRERWEHMKKTMQEVIWQEDLERVPGIGADSIWVKTTAQLFFYDHDQIALVSLGILHDKPTAVHRKLAKRVLLSMQQKKANR